MAARAHLRDLDRYTHLSESFLIIPGGDTPSYRREREAERKREGGRGVVMERGTATERHDVALFPIPIRTEPKHVDVRSRSSPVQCR